MEKAKEISVLWEQIKPQIDEMIHLCYEVESHYEVTTDAYQRGYKQGINAARNRKASCQYCQHTDKSEDDEPCVSCCCRYSNMFEPEAKEEQITKGDVVRIKSAPEIEILVTCADGDYVSGIALTEVDDNCEIGDQYTDIVIHKVEKTGEHYDITEVLRKMREE